MKATKMLRTLNMELSLLCHRLTKVVTHSCARKATLLRNKQTKSYAQKAKPESRAEAGPRQQQKTLRLQQLFTALFLSEISSKIMAVFNWNYFSFYELDSTYLKWELGLIPIVVAVLWFVWMKIVR